MHLLPLSIAQALLLAAGQVIVKVALTHVGRVEWTWQMVRSQLTNWWWPAAGLCLTGAGLLWAYILRHYPFSVAYPLSSLAYVFGLVAAWALFDERLSVSTWAGVLLIMAGCWLVAR